MSRQLLPGAVAFLEMLEARGIQFYFLTNNSSKSRMEYTHKMKRLGLDYPEERFFTSGEATAIYLNRQKIITSRKVPKHPRANDDTQKQQAQYLS